RTRGPVRSPIDKLIRGGLVVGSVTTSEYLLLYVFLPVMLSGGHRRLGIFIGWDRKIMRLCSNKFDLHSAVLRSLDESDQMLVTY
ncbi:hypothetical protein BKA60DRAFT_550631, partial [Fusarium oxysporum]